MLWPTVGSLLLIVAATRAALPFRDDQEVLAALKAGEAQENGVPELYEENEASDAAQWQEFQRQQMEAEREKAYFEQLLEEEAAQDELLERKQKEQEMLAVLGEINAGYEQMQKELNEQEQQENLPERSAASEADMAHAPTAPEQPVQKETIVETEVQQPTAAAPSAQKKGQSEFVSFVDPEASLLTASKLSADKRHMDNVRSEKIRHSGGLVFLGVGTVMLVGVLGAAVGGSVYYKRRNEEPDDQEYAPYAGTGPRGIKSLKGEKGDDALAYKAQLHHYQQAKQKIICGDDAPGVGGDTDGEDDVDDENNFSVYECPGLAPTGDIEVHNPNFAAH